VRGSFTDRMVMIVCTVGLSVSILVLHHRVPVRVRLQARLVPGAGWGDRLRRESLRVRVAADPDRPRRQHRADLRLYRTFVLDEIYQDYVRTARAKGVSENRIMWIHVLRNASIPIITF
jgi:peptide/nickel transport system permease protein